MRLLLLFIVVALVAGCANARDPQPAATAAGTGTVAVGQPWREARAVALGAGYELHDASQLAMHPTPEGFSIDMFGRRGLLVLRDAQRDVVSSVQWIENWDGPKAFRVYHNVRAFDVPPADPAAR